MSKVISDSSLTPDFLKDIGISHIHDAQNLWYKVSDIKDLAISIQQKGLLQPILVRTGEGSFEIVAGNRRSHACKDLGWKRITCPCNRIRRQTSVRGLTYRKFEEKLLVLWMKQLPSKPTCVILDGEVYQS